MDSSMTGHRVIMEERGRVEVTGVIDLLIFDENEIVLDTSPGNIEYTRDGSAHEQPESRQRTDSPGGRYR